MHCSLVLDRLLGLGDAQKVLPIVGELRSLLSAHQASRIKNRYCIKGLVKHTAHTYAALPDDAPM